MRIDFSVCSSVDQQAQKREREREGGGGEEEEGGNKKAETEGFKHQMIIEIAVNETFEWLSRLSCMLRWNAWTLHCGQSCIEASTPFVVSTDQQRQLTTA